MATIRIRESGWWQAIVDRKGHPIQSKTFELESDAVKWARDIESKIDRDVFTDRSAEEAKTLKEALSDYEREVSVKKDGHDVEKIRIVKWQRHPIAKKSLAQLKPADFAKWLAERLKDVSPSTARKDLAIISHLFTVAQKRWGMHLTNPIERIEIPVEDNSRDRRLEDGEEDYLMKALAKSGAGARTNNWLLPLCKIAIETAARQSELLNIKWKDVDMSKLGITIRGKERADGKSRLKNKSKSRDVPISPTTKEILDALPRDIKGKVFPTTASAVKQSFARATARGKNLYLKDCKKDGVKPKEGFLDDLHFHDLRHESTSRLAELYPIQTLMKITGHDDTRMLARYYHPKIEDMAKVLWAQKKA